MREVLIDLRECESAEIAGISCNLDATTRINSLSNISWYGIGYPVVS